MTKRTKRRIFKSVLFARGLFLTLFVIFMLLCAVSANGESVLTAVIFFTASIACFGISYFCDYVVGGYKSPFYH